MEGKKEWRKLLPAKAAPSFLVHRMEDLTDTRNQSDVDAGSPRGAGGELRGEKMVT
jgi:hypothetical protein